LSETLPEGWIYTTLGDLSTYVTSGSRDWSQFYSDHGALFIRTQDINQNRLAPADEIARVALPKKAEGKRTLVTQGDLLITITGANVGKCAHVDIPLPEAYVSQSVALVRLVKAFSGRFVQRQLISPASDDELTPLQQSAYGVGRPVLNLDNVRNAPIVLAPFSEQERIVAKIDKLFSEVDSAHDHLSRVPAILKRFRQAVLAAACSGRLTEDWREKQSEIETATLTLERIHWKRSTEKQPNTLTVVNSEDLPDLPDSWVWARFGVLIGELRNGISIKPELSPPGISILRINSVRSGSVSLNEHRFLPRGAELLPEYCLRDGDLLFTRYNGSLDLLGVCGMVRGLGNASMLYPDKLMRVRFDHSHILPAYAELFFQSAGARDRLTAQSRSSAGQQGVSGADIKSQPFALPPFLEQVEIIDRVSPLVSLANTIENRLAKALMCSDKLTQSILAKAFRGELVPTEAELARREGREYEPASVLLEQINKERVSEIRPSRVKRGARKASAQD
jgi:type I restriction enzyme, S subunit